MRLLVLTILALPIICSNVDAVPQDDLLEELLRLRGKTGLSIASVGNFTMEVTSVGRPHTVEKRPFPFEFMIGRIAPSGLEAIGLLMDGSLVKTDIAGRVSAVARKYSHLRSLALSRDGSMVALCGAFDVAGSAHGHLPRSGDRKYGIALIDLRTDSASALLTFAAPSDLAGCGDITWAPSAEYVVYGYKDKLYRYSLRSRESRFLREGSLPAWHPDGHWIAFRGRDSRIYLTDQSGRNSRVLVECNAVGGLRWSPDGRFLAFGETSRSGAAGSRLSVTRLIDGVTTSIRTSIHPEIGRDEGWAFVKPSQ